jgi:hypothetical protein
MCMKIDLFFTLSCCFALLSAGAVVSRGISRVQHALYVEFITIICKLLESKFVPLKQKKSPPHAIRFQLAILGSTRV